MLFGGVKDVNKYLYHYTSAEIAIKHIFQEKRLRFSPINFTNDPKEFKSWAFSLSCPSISPEPEEFFKFQDEANLIIKSNCKLLCLTRDDPFRSKIPPNEVFGRGFSHSRMWAQYSNNHKGVCLILNRYELSNFISEELGYKSKIYQGQVNYNDRSSYEAFHLNYDQVVNHGLKNVLENQLSKYVGTLFFEKALDWRDEWEYRFMIMSPDTEFEYVSINKSIEAIVLGADFPKEQEEIIKTLCKSLNVPAARIIWQNGLPILVPFYPI